MATMKEMAQQYEPKETKNISDLEKVNVNIDVQEVTYTKDDGTDFKVLETEIDGQKYRVPQSVLKQLKGIVEKFPDTEYVSVSKTGEGLKTEYQVFKL